MAERIITQIELLIHPDYRVKWGTPVDATHVDLRTRWNARVAELAKRRDALMLYFPTIHLEDDPETLGSTPKPQIGREAEVLRRQEYQELLGERFFLFLETAPSNLPDILKDRGFAYKPTATLLVAYGEYLEVCVSDCQEEVGDILGIPPVNRILDSKLSVRSPLIDPMKEILIKQMTAQGQQSDPANKNPAYVFSKLTRAYDLI